MARLDAAMGAVAQAAYAGAHQFAGNREGQGDHLTLMASDTVATGVQVIDNESLAT